MGTNNLPEKEKERYTNITIENTALLALGLCLFSIIVSVILQVVWRPPSEQDIIRIVKEQIEPDMNIIKTKGFEAVLDQLVENANHSFQKMMLERIQDQYANIVEHNCVHFKEGHKNIQYMRMAVDNTKKSIKGISVHTPDGWKDYLTPYDNANIEAIKRGVTITRIFIILNKHYKNNSSEINSLISVMEKQRKYKTIVKYAFEDEIKEILPNVGIYSCALFDNNLFGYDIYSFSGDHTEEICITWDEKHIKEKNIIPKIENTKHVYSFEVTEECKNHIISHKPIK